METRGENKRWKQEVVFVSKVEGITQSGWPTSVPNTGLMDTDSAALSPTLTSALTTTATTSVTADGPRRRAGDGAMEVMAAVRTHAEPACGHPADGK